MTQDTSHEARAAAFERERQFYQDVKDLFATPAGQRFLAWWRKQARQGHAVLVPGDSHATHFCLGRQADVNAVIEILQADMAELLGQLQERMERQQQSGRGTDEGFGLPAEDWLFQKGHNHGEE